MDCFIPDLIDCQQNTRHPASLGGREIARKTFVAHVHTTVAAASIPWRFDKTALLEVLPQAVM